MLASTILFTLGHWDQFFRMFLEPLTKFTQNPIKAIELKFWPDLACMTQSVPAVDGAATVSFPKTPLQKPSKWGPAWHIIWSGLAVSFLSSFLSCTHIFDKNAASYSIPLSLSLSPAPKSWNHFDWRDLRKLRDSAYCDCGGGVHGWCHQKSLPRCRSVFPRALLFADRSSDCDDVVPLCAVVGVVDAGIFVLFSFRVCHSCVRYLGRFLLQWVSSGFDSRHFSWSEGYFTRCFEWGKKVTYT